MKVLLCEDHSKPEIYGGICVHAGSKNDPPEATGMAHYFEHIMFKGTDKIGTTDWEAEKPYLDSIACWYDRLRETKKRKERESILQTINNLTITSAQYAIPNEVDAILGKMGGTGLNAATSYDETVYFNKFPANQLEKWMEVYTERFRNPVFRLFQSELEAVYEEKNMYANSFFTAAFEDVLKAVFGKHPYSRPIIGYSEHLKNPSLNLMQKFFETYYVANNMSLVLAGDFNTSEITELIEKHFGTLRSGELPTEHFSNVPEFKGRTEVKRRLTPIKVGLLGYRVENSSSPENYKIEILNNIFSNNSSTGLLDRLVSENKMYTAEIMHFPLREHGVLGFLFLPKILIQSLGSAEKLIMNCIDSVKAGKFGNDLFNAVKTEYLLEKIKNLETLENKFWIVLDAENAGKKGSDYLDEIDKIKALTKEDIVTVANKYLSDNYLVYSSKMGFPKKESVKKPDWAPVIPQNTDQMSAFAKKIDEQKVESMKQQVIDFQKDVAITPLSDGYTLYSAPNNINDIFSLSISFRCGQLQNAQLPTAVDYFNSQGSEKKSFHEFNLALQTIGGSLSVTVSDNLLTLSLSGFDKDLDTLLKLCSEKVYHPSNDESRLKMMMTDRRMEFMMQKRTPEALAHAAYEWAIFGEQSRYRDIISVRELQSYSGRQLLDIFNQALQYDGYVTYTGTTPPQQVKDAILTCFPLKENPQTGDYLVRRQQQYDAPALFYVHKRKSLQSNIYFHINGEKYRNDKDRSTQYCFNEYFGDGMYSIIFQEIREFRSLGYTVRSFYNYGFLNKEKGYLYGFLGTQSDKTIDGIDAMRQLMTDMPKKSDKFATARESLLRSRSANYIGFRSIPESVRQWLQQGYQQDPRPAIMNIIETTTLDDVSEFFDYNIKGKPLIVSLSGNMKKVDKKALSKFGKVKKLRVKEVMKR